MSQGVILQASKLSQTRHTQQSWSIRSVYRIWASKVSTWRSCREELAGVIIFPIRRWNWPGSEFEDSGTKSLNPKPRKSSQFQKVRPLVSCSTHRGEHFEWSPASNGGRTWSESAFEVSGGRILWVTNPENLANFRRWDHLGFILLVDTKILSGHGRRSEVGRRSYGHLKFLIVFSDQNTVWIG